MKVAMQVTAAALDSSAVVGDSLFPYQQSVMQGVAATLLDEARSNRPILIVIDDAHLIDPSSQTVLDYLADEIATRHMGIVLAARSEGASVIANK